MPLRSTVTITALAASMAGIGIPAAAAGLISADAPQGTWFFSNLDGKGSGTLGHEGTLTFLPNGSYIHLETGPNEGHGYPGLEVGTYTFTPKTATMGNLSFTTLLDTNGDWGANSDSFDVDITQVAATKCFRTPDATAICSDAPNTTSWPLAWYQGVGYGNISVLVFFANGHYLHGVDPAIGVLEAGTFNWDPATGALSLSNVVRHGSGDEVTLSQLGATAMAFDAQALRLTTPTGTVSFAATPTTPVPEPSSLLLFGVGALALACRRRAA